MIIVSSALLLLAVASGVGEYRGFSIFFILRLSFEASATILAPLRHWPRNRHILAIFLLL